MNKYSFLLLFAWILLSSCDKDGPNPPPSPPTEVSRICVNPKYGGQTLYLDSIYEAPNGYKIKITDIKFYVSSFGFQDQCITQASLFDYREKGNVLLAVDKKHSLFPSLSGILGVDTLYNHLDPSAFPNSSPLNISNSGPMHWGWNPGYIFINVEGKADTLINGIDNLDLSFSYHVGTDYYLVPINYNNIQWIKTGDYQYTFNLNLDLYQFFFNATQPILINSEYFTHSGSGTEILTQKVVTNFNNALTQ